ncbi:NAD(P)H-dependent flavin oxidoreductase [Pseudophaeobacter flagellatus]|uniref:NAD(P)H-dependent flavin oxidoreductase n=1 Tax=Pseudophaeobacter flagellatus TaxID=2899119 RepID=UPI001E4B194C|nr:nitronate monooxygenase [Pseudophaeobacter flagellatus]MCD9147483.1 nitronate monooxygenase [Pseudophaeobacter flagellatus]
MSSDLTVLAQLGLTAPIIQAPMAGVATPQMAAAVSKAGGLGSLGIGASTVAAARDLIRQTRMLTDRPFNANVFCHHRAIRNTEKETAWLNLVKPEFERFAASPPKELSEVYKSFLDGDAMFDMLLEERPAVVSFHFGLPTPSQIKTFKDRNILMLATATNLQEARQAAAIGIDAVVAQGWEAGGHRGCFDENAEDDQLGTFALTRILVQELDIPVIAAGGIMDGAGIRAALNLGAVAAQLGTAFIATDESAAPAAYREALAGESAHHTCMVRVISGRPARCLANRFTQWSKNIPDASVPDYPVTYDAGKALNAAATHRGDTGYGAHWAGQGAPLSRAMSATQLVHHLITEIQTD